MSQAEDLLRFLASRRSVRRFKKTPVDLSTVLRAIEIARYAPSARNSQPWRFIIVTDERLKETLSSIHGAAWPLREAPLGVLIACNTAESPVSYLADCANATIYFMLAAHALGLGTVWIQTLRDIDKLRELLSLPLEYIPVALIAVGYPDEQPQAKPRKPLEEIVFFNKFGESQLVRDR
ncbi:MAG: nitroreductase family protein [Acidilobaceae archaeon]